MENPLSKLGLPVEEFWLPRFWWLAWWNQNLTFQFPAVFRFCITSTHRQLDSILTKRLHTLGTFKRKYFKAKFEIKIIFLPNKKKYLINYEDKFIEILSWSHFLLSSARVNKVITIIRFLLYKTHFIKERFSILYQWVTVVHKEWHNQFIKKKKLS